MQALYSYNQMPDMPITQVEKTSHTYIRNSYRLILFNIVCLKSFLDHIQDLATIKLNKHIPSEEDLNFSTKIVTNDLSTALLNDEAFDKLAKSEKVHALGMDKSLLQKLYTSLSETEEYLVYNSKETSGKDDLNMLLMIHEKIMLQEEEYDLLMEEKFNNWWDDKQIISFGFKNILETFFRSKKLASDIYSNIEDEEKFTTDILFQTLEHEDELRLLIEPKLKNWDTDRVALMDMILIRMAICEMLYFPSIPIKVTLNEYIDISKI
ncbi:MAG: hypothetical protein IH946_12240, partial [Bacteroidetes bacterium]|nr:hypothetical protein [Bacteroidota bacterium]